jgi:hypothetical protein
MKDEVFTELLGSAHEALEHAQGKRSLRTTTLPLPPKSLNGRAVKRVRASLHASQAVFARLSERKHQAGPGVGGQSPHARRASVGAPPHRGATTAAD